MWVAVILSGAALVAGLVIALVFESLLGAVLILGGIGGLGWAMAPAVLDRVTRFLSTGSMRRNRW